MPVSVRTNALLKKILKVQDLNSVYHSVLPGDEGGNRTHLDQDSLTVGTIRHAKPSEVQDEAFASSVT